MITWLKEQSVGSNHVSEEAFYDTSGSKSSVWIETPFQATLRGSKLHGERFQLETRLDALSNSHLSLRLPWEVHVGQSLLVVIWLGMFFQQGAEIPRVAVRGVVVRAEQRPGGVWRTTIGFRRHRFLYPASLCRGEGTNAMTNEIL